MWASYAFLLSLGLVTIPFLYITLAAVLYEESVVKEMFAIPVASLFAFPSLRSNMPGAPEGFGEHLQIHVLDG
jgi:hypothetical protein